MQAARKSSTTVVAPQTVEIVVAAEDLEANRIVKDGSITTKAVPRDKAPKGYSSDTTQVIGKVLTSSLLKGQPITSDVVSDPGPVERLQHLLPPNHGLVALSVPAAEITLVVPNAIVDIIAFVKEPGDDRVLHGCLLDRVPVWSVGNWTILDRQTQEEGAKSKSVTRRSSAGPLYLMINEEQQELLQMAQYLKANLMVVLRNPTNPVARTGAVDFLLKLEDLWRRAHSKPREEDKGPKGGGDGEQAPPPPPVVVEKPVGQEFTGRVKATEDAKGDLHVTLTTEEGTKYIVDIQDGKGRDLAAEMAGAQVVVTGTVSRKEKPAPEWEVELLKAQTVTTVKGKVAGATQEHDLILKVNDYKKWGAGDGKASARVTGLDTSKPTDHQRVGKQGASGNGGKPGTHHRGEN